MKIKITDPAIQGLDPSLAGQIIEAAPVQNVCLLEEGGVNSSWIVAIHKGSGVEIVDNEQEVNEIKNVHLASAIEALIHYRKLGLIKYLNIKL